MDKAFVDRCFAIVPPMNPRIMDGHLTHEIKDQERRIDETIRKAFDGRFGGRLRCGGLEQCSPQESYQYAIKPKNTERTFELAPSDVYLCRTKLFFDEEHLVDVYIYLLTVERGALARISRTLYSFRPTIADKVISPENKLIFVRLDQYRTNLMQLSHPISVNGRHLMESEVVWGQIHKSSKEKKTGPKAKAKSCLVHYLLGHYGLTEMFKKHVGYAPIYGNKEAITEEKYPKNKWLIIKTAHSVARAVSCTEMNYVPTELHMAIPIDKWTTRMKAYVMSVFYIVDSFPSILTLDKMEHINSWRLTLGHILFSPSLTLQRVLNQVDEHFDSSDTYMDVESIHKLKQNNHDVKDFRDLMALLAGEFTSLLQSSASGSLYGKYLDTLRDVLDPVIKSINNTKYELMKLELKKNAITPNKIKDCIVRSIRTGAIFDNNKNSQLVETCSSCTDHPYYKMTSRLGVADRSPGGKSKNRVVLGERHYANTSKMMVGSLLNLSKHNPILESHANPWMMTDPDNGTILEDPTMAAELAEVDAKLNMKRGRN